VGAGIAVEADSRRCPNADGLCVDTRGNERESQAAVTVTVGVEWALGSVGSLQ
jgi:hypothetical protein